MLNKRVLWRWTRLAAVLTFINSIYLIYSYSHYSFIGKGIFDTYPATLTTDRSDRNLVGNLENKAAQKQTIVSLVDVDHVIQQKGVTGLERRHHIILHYNMPSWTNLTQTNEYVKDTRTCRYNNCFYTDDRELLSKSSAVIFTISNSIPSHVAPAKHEDQVWIFMETESPYYNYNWFYRHESWRKKVNWTMTYRLDSDILRSYGYLKSSKRTPEKKYEGILERKPGFAVWIVSHCGSIGGRDEYVRELQKYISVDIYGRCGSQLNEDWRDVVSRYKYYLGFENIFCKDYVTEKFFDKFELDTVLVVRGGADYDRILPNDTFINTARFASVKSLAQFLITLSTNEKDYKKYLKKRDEYKILSPNVIWMCSLCEKLNHQHLHRQLYDDFVSWWVSGTCWLPSDVILDTRVTIKSTVFVVMIWAVCVVFVCTRRKYRKK